MGKFNADNIVVSDTIKTTNLHIDNGYVKGNLIPDGNTQSIGTPSRPWKELYVSENTIKFINSSTYEEMNSIGVDETGNIKFGGNGLNLSSITADTTLDMKDHSITLGSNIISSTDNGMLNITNGLQLDQLGNMFISNNKFKFNMGIVAPSDLKIEDDEDGSGNSTLVIIIAAAVCAVVIVGALAAVFSAKRGAAGAERPGTADRGGIAFENPTYEIPVTAGAPTGPGPAAANYQDIAADTPANYQDVGNANPSSYLDVASQPGADATYDDVGPDTQLGGAEATYAMASPQSSVGTHEVDDAADFDC